MEGINARVDRAIHATSEYHGINTEADQRTNRLMSCVPASMLDGNIANYSNFLEELRRLMAHRTRIWFELL